MKELIKHIALVLFVMLLTLLIASCETIDSPEEVNLSGRYQCNNQGMILLLEHNYRTINAVLEWGGFVTSLEGKYDRTNKQLIMSGNYFGYQNISFDLFYGNKSLKGGFNYNTQGTKAVHFEFKNILKMHDQGAIYSNQLELDYDSSGKYYPLSGGLNFGGSGTIAICFKKIGNLQKHNQGGLWNSKMD